MRYVVWLTGLSSIILSSVATMMLTADIDVSGPMNLWPPPVFLFVVGYSGLLVFVIVVWFFTKHKLLALSLMMAGLLSFGYALYRDWHTPDSPEEAMLTPRYQRYTLDVTFPSRAAFYSAYGFGVIYLAAGIILFRHQHNTMKLAEYTSVTQKSIEPQRTV